MPINRRQFLFGLIGLGAAVSLPAAATVKDIDEAWDRMVQKPWHFEVDEYGTIVLGDDPEPSIRSDVYDDIWLDHKPDSLIQEILQYEELRSHFQTLAADELEDVERALDDGPSGPADRRRLLKLREALEDADDGWQDWIRIEGRRDMQRFHAEIEDWLSSPLDWSFSEFWPKGWSGQGRALSFFQHMDRDIRDDIGIVIVEGDHPGSSYYAAELRSSVDDANETAEGLMLPFRFR